jgi:hypothetical protein
MLVAQESGEEGWIVIPQAAHGFAQIPGQLVGVGEHVTGSTGRRAVAVARRGARAIQVSSASGERWRFGVVGKLTRIAHETIVVEDVIASHAKITAAVDIEMSVPLIHRQPDRQGASSDLIDDLPVSAVEHQHGIGSEYCHEGEIPVRRPEEGDGCRLTLGCTDERWFEDQAMTQLATRAHDRDHVFLCGAS